MNETTKTVRPKKKDGEQHASY